MSIVFKKGDPVWVALNLSSGRLWWTPGFYDRLENLMPLDDSEPARHGVLLCLELEHRPDPSPWWFSDNHILKEETYIARQLAL